MKEGLDEILKEISAKRKDNGEFLYNRFNKRNFTKLVNALASDPEFKSEYVKVSKGEITKKTEVQIGKMLRAWIRKIVESAGVDSIESKFVLSEDYEIPNINWLYDFMCEAIYIYIKKGNMFTLPAKEDFCGSIYLREIAKTEKVRTFKNPHTHEVIGKYKITSEPHDELKTKSSCPKYLTDKEEC